MGIIEGLLALLPANPIPVRSVVVGVRWTAVTSLGCGLAASCLRDQTGIIESPTGAGQLHQKSAQELAQWMLAGSGLEASIGLAAYSSTLRINSHQVMDINAIDLLAQRGAGRNVVMVGHFKYADWLRTRVGSLKILELHPQPGDFPAEAAPDLIPQADLVAITGMTILNRTLDGLLALRQPSAEVMLIGPSTPLSPALFDFGIDFISGTYVTSEEDLLQTIMQGGSARHASGTHKITLCKNPNQPGLPATNFPTGRI